MIQKQNITEEELVTVMLSCDWSSSSTRAGFAAEGLYLNVLVNDPDPKVQWLAKTMLSTLKANK